MSAGGESIAFRYALGTRQFVLPSSALGLEGFYRELIARVAGVTARSGETLRAYGERLYKMRSIESDIAKLNKRRLASHPCRVSRLMPTQIPDLRKENENGQGT